MRIRFALFVVTHFPSLLSRMSDVTTVQPSRRPRPSSRPSPFAHTAAMATLTISLSTLLLAAAVLAAAYALYRLYDLFCVQPVKFQQYWKAQGIDGATQRDAQQRRPAQPAAQ